MATTSLSLPVDQFEVKAKVAIVTGAASGIGLAITRCLLKKGAKVSCLRLMYAVWFNKGACIHYVFHPIVLFFHGPLIILL